MEEKDNLQDIEKESVENSEVKEQGTNGVKTEELEQEETKIEEQEQEETENQTVGETKTEEQNQEDPKVTKVEEISTEGNNNRVKEEKCLNCGATLKPEFCPKCGMKRGTQKKLYCPTCGEEVKVGQKFCPKCGGKTNIGVNNVMDSVIRTCKKNMKKIIIVLILVVGLILIGKQVLPKIFISTEELLAQGEYEKAYKKASTKEKEDIEAENLIAVLCNDVIEGYKDPSSFELRDAWYDKDKKVVVLKTGGKNSYGGIVFSYDYFTYSEDEGKYEYYCSLSDLKKEETSKYDDYEETLEKILKNAARSVVSEVINKNDCKLSNDSVKNINHLFKEDKLEEIELIKVNEGKTNKG